MPQGRGEEEVEDPDGYTPRYVSLEILKNIHPPLRICSIPAPDLASIDFSCWGYHRPLNLYHSWHSLRPTTAHHPDILVLTVLDCFNVSRYPGTKDQSDLNQHVFGGYAPPGNRPPPATFQREPEKSRDVYGLFPRHKQLFGMVTVSLSYTCRSQILFVLLTACWLVGSTFMGVSGEAIEDSVGKAEYSRCKLVYTWSDLTLGYKDQEIRFHTGGLGSLMSDEYVSWVCMKDHYCASGADKYFCFVYNEINHSFVPWGKNEELQLVEVSDKSCICNQTAHDDAEGAAGSVTVCSPKFYSESASQGLSLPPCLACPSNSSSQLNSIGIASCICNEGYIGPNGGPCKPGYTNCWTQSCAGYKECYVEKNSLGNSVPSNDPRRVYLDATYYKIDETWNSGGVWRSPVNNGTRLCPPDVVGVWNVMPWDKPCSTAWGQRDGYVDQALVNSAFMLDLQRTGNLRYGTLRCRF
eukprot:767846-Hanusia_phi.AAC.2